MVKDDVNPEYERVGAGALKLVESGATPRPDTVTSTAPGQSSGTFSALRHRNFRLFWIGALVSNLGGWFQVVAQNWLVLSLTGSPFLLGLVNFIGNSPMLILSLVGGVVADRNSRKLVLLVTQNAQALLMLLMAVLSFLNISLA